MLLALVLAGAWAARRPEPAASVLSPPAASTELVTAAVATSSPPPTPCMGPAPAAAPAPAPPPVSPEALDDPHHLTPVDREALPGEDEEELAP